MILNYLNTLKNKGNFTIETIANLSGVPEPTVKNIFSGKTEDPRFETVSAIVVAMGGSLDSIYTAAKKDDVEANAVITIKESYEQRIADIKEHYEHRLNEKDKHYERLLLEAEKHIDTIKLDKRWFRIGFVVSIFIFALLCVAELLNPNLGWLRY
jgi:predicted transcriptional regulator